MTKKISFLIALSLMGLAAEGAMNTALPKFLSQQEIVARFSSTQSSRTPASLPVSVNNTDVDLRAYDSPVVSQFGGTCSTFATAAVMENVLRSHGVQKLVSHHDLWNDYGVYDADAAVQAASNNYITELQYWTDNGTRAADYQDHQSMKITQSTPHQYDYQAAIRALDQNHPVVMAIQVPKDLDNCSPTIDPNSARTKGNHVMAAVGYHLDSSVAGGGYFILKNSWGPDCGDHGYHYYPFALCQRNDLYCYFIEVNNVESK
jgi:C1A family cysteine protease